MPATGFHLCHVYLILLPCFQVDTHELFLPSLHYLLLSLTLVYYAVVNGIMVLVGFFFPMSIKNKTVNVVYHVYYPTPDYMNPY